MPYAYTLTKLADLIGGTLRGESSVAITGVADVTEAGPTEASWASSPKYAQAVATSRAGVVLIRPDFGPTRMPAILCERIDESIARLLAAFAPPVSRPAPGVHSSAIVHPSAEIGPDPAIGAHVVIDEGVRVGARCVLHPGVFIGRDTRIGDDCQFWPNVVIRDGCVVGSRVTIHPNSVIGSDGFGYYFQGGRHHRVPHIGGVILGDDVEIGACTCVDRAKFGFTIVGAGTKIDNQVQIAHNDRLGNHCIIAGQTGLGGSVRIGDFSVLGGCVVCMDNLSIGDRVTAAGSAVIRQDVPPGTTIAGDPAQEHRAQMRQWAAAKQLPELLAKVRDLTARLERLEASTYHRT